MTFRKFISFKQSENNIDDDKKRNIKTLSAVIATTISAGLLSLLAFKSLQKTAKTYENYLIGMENNIKNTSLKVYN